MACKQFHCDFDRYGNLTEKIRRDARVCLEIIFQNEWGTQFYEYMSSSLEELANKIHQKIMDRRHKDWQYNNDGPSTLMVGILTGEFEEYLPKNITTAGMKKINEMVAKCLEY